MHEEYAIFSKLGEIIKFWQYFAMWVYQKFF